MFSHFFSLIKITRFTETQSLIILFMKKRKWIISL